MGPSSRSRPIGRWRDRVKEYMCERDATRERWLDQRRKGCLDRKNMEDLLPGNLRGCFSFSVLL